MTITASINGHRVVVIPGNNGDHGLHFDGAFCGDYPTEQRAYDAGKTMAAVALKCSDCGHEWEGEHAYTCPNCHSDKHVRQA